MALGSVGLSVGHHGLIFTSTDNSEITVPIGESTMLTNTNIFENVLAVAIAGNVLAPNLGAGTMFTTTINDNFTLTPSFVVAGRSWTMLFTGNGSAFTQTWTNVTWLTAGGVAPTMTTTNGKRDLIGFTTFDGTEILASVGAQDF